MRLLKARHLREFLSKKEKVQVEQEQIEAIPQEDSK